MKNKKKNKKNNVNDELEKKINTMEKGKDYYEEVDDHIKLENQDKRTQDEEDE